MDQKQAAADLKAIIAEQQDQLNQRDSYIKALVEEFTECDDIEAIRKKFREEIAKYAPTALVNIINLANNAESESVQASMNKYIIDWAMSDKIDSSKTGVGALLEELKKVPAPVPADVNTTNGI